MALEQSEENYLVTEVQDLRTKFLTENRCIQETRLDSLLQDVLSAGKTGVAVLEADSDRYNFDFTSSLFFVTTFLTTTGETEKSPYHTNVRLSSDCEALLEYAGRLIVEIEKVYSPSEMNLDIA